MKKIKIISTIIIILITILSVFSYFYGDILDWEVTLLILARYTFMLISFSAGSCIIYHFFKVFFEKHKYRKLICYSLTAIVIALCLTWYILDHRQPRVVYMKEDVLYIKPATNVK